MKQIIIILLIFGATNLFAQQQQDSVLIKEIQTIKNNVFQQRKDINILTRKLNNQEVILGNQAQLIDSLQNENKKLTSSIDNLSQNIIINSKKLKTKIQNTGEKTDLRISKLDNSLSKNQLYWIIAAMVILLLGGLVYWLLGKRIKLSKTDVETQIKNTKTAFEEESVKLDSQLLEIINSQLKIKESESESSSSDEKDHSLVLKVADEVTRILMNLEVMDQSIKGYKHLKKYSDSILDNLKAYGYEIPQLMGQNYNSGMNMVATLEFDDTIKEGKQIIKRIIKPQVDFNKKMIQAAKVIVAFNE